MLQGVVVVAVVVSGFMAPDTVRVPGGVGAAAGPAVVATASKAATGSGLIGPRRVERFQPVSLLPAVRAGAGVPAVVADTPVVQDTPVARPRPRAIEYSDAYNTRLEIHRIGSYLILPMFAGEYWLGQKLISQTTPAASWVKPTHKAVAYGVTAVFAANTVTGFWNLWDSRKDPNGRTRRWVHTLTMLAADGGFVAADLSAHHAAFSHDREVRHRNIALASIGLSTASGLYMWLTK